MQETSKNKGEDVLLKKRSKSGFVHQSNREGRLSNLDHVRHFLDFSHITHILSITSQHILLIPHITLLSYREAARRVGTMAGQVRALGTEGELGRRVRRTQLGYNGLMPHRTTLCLINSSSVLGGFRLFDSNWGKLHLCDRQITVIVITSGRNYSRLPFVGQKKYIICDKRTDWIRKRQLESKKNGRTNELP